MTWFRVAIFDAETGGRFESPDGCDSYPHEIMPYYVPGRGFTLVTVWREMPTPIVDPPPNPNARKVAAYKQPSKKRKGKP